MEATAAGAMVQEMKVVPAQFEYFADEAKKPLECVVVPRVRPRAAERFHGLAVAEKGWESDLVDDFRDTPDFDLALPPESTMFADFFLDESLQITKSESPCVSQALLKQGLPALWTM